MPSAGGEFVWPGSSASRVPSRSSFGIGKYLGSKSPIVRSQTGRPFACIARISPAMRRISEPTTPRASAESPASLFSGESRYGATSTDLQSIACYPRAPMRWSQSFLVTLREVPGDAEVVSHQLLYRAGLIHKLAAGIYSFTPFGFRSLRKMIDIVREEMDATGAMEVDLPILQPKELWVRSQKNGGYCKWGKAARSG